MRQGFGYTKPPAGAQINWGHPLARGLIGCWLFNEASGSRARDCAWEVHGDLGSAVPVLWAGSARGSAVEFPGVITRAVTLERGAIYDANQQGTIEAWIYVYSITGFRHIFGVADGVNINELFGLRIMNAGGGGFLEVATRSPNNRYLTLVAVPLNEWVQVAATSDGASWRLYMNGQEEPGVVSLGVNSGGWFSDVVGAAANLYAIGILLRAGGFIQPFHGLIEQVTLYNRALTAIEIMQLYTEPYAMIHAPVASRIFHGAAV